SMGAFIPRRQGGFGFRYCIREPRRPRMAAVIFSLLDRLAGCDFLTAAQAYERLIAVPAKQRPPRAPGPSREGDLNGKPGRKEWFWTGNQTRKRARGETGDGRSGGGSGAASGTGAGDCTGVVRVRVDPCDVATRLRDAVPGTPVPDCDADSVPGVPGHLPAG